MANVVTNITGPALQPGTSNEYYVTWVYKKTHLKEFSYEWLYYNRSGVVFEGSSGTVDASSPPVSHTYTSTYSPPEEATTIAFRVKPVAKTHSKKVKKQTRQVEYWKGSWSNFQKKTTTPNLVPDNPSNPDIEVKDNRLTAFVEVSDSKTTQIQFQVIQDDTTQYNVGTANVILSRATFSWDIPEGHHFKVRCRAYGSGGLASLEWSGYSSTAYSRLPKLTGQIDIEQLTPESIKITFATPVSGAEAYEVEYTTNKDYFDASSLVSSETVATKGNYIIISGISQSSGGIYYFRIRGKRTSQTSAAEAEWSDILSLPVGKAPTAPSTWSSTSTAKIDEDVILYWIHNSADGSRERSADLWYSIKFSDGFEQTSRITINNPDFANEFAETKVRQYVFPTWHLGKDYEVSWRIRTRGIIDEYSPYSTTRKFKVYYPPTVTVGIFKRNEWFWDPFDFEIDDIYSAIGELKDPYNLPDEPITQYPILIGAIAEPLTQQPLEANFTIFSEQAYETLDFDGTAKFVGEGEQIFSKTVSYFHYADIANRFHLVLLPSDILLENGMTYRLLCTVAMGSGLKAETEVIFTMDLDSPDYDVNAEITYDEENYCCYIQPFCMDEEENLVKNVKLSVYRRNFDGEFIAIAKNLKNTDQITVLDPHPNLNQALYRLVAQSGTSGGIFAYDLPPEPIEETSIVIQWDERWKDFIWEGEDPLFEPVITVQRLVLPYNVDITDNSSIDVSHVEYIGRKHPVSYYGTQVGQTASWSSEIPWDDTETIDKIRQLQIFTGDCYVRELNGAGYWATVNISFTRTHCELAIPVTLDITRVEGGV